MNEKGNYRWRLLSPGINYFWFDHQDALQVKKTNLIARNDTPLGTGFYSIFPPSECCLKSYSSVFFRVLVHEINIKIFVPCWLCSYIWSTTKRREPILFFSHVFGACLCMSGVCVHMHKYEWVCKCGCIREQEIGADLKTKLLGFWTLRMIM